MLRRSTWPCDTTFTERRSPSSSSSSSRSSTTARQNMHVRPFLSGWMQYSTVATATSVSPPCPSFSFASLSTSARARLRRRPRHGAASVSNVPRSMRPAVPSVCPASTSTPSPTLHTIPSSLLASGGATRSAMVQSTSRRRRCSSIMRDFASWCCEWVKNSRFSNRPEIDCSCIENSDACRERWMGFGQLRQSIQKARFKIDTSSHLLDSSNLLQVTHARVHAYERRQTQDKREDGDKQRVQAAGAQAVPTHD